jgi:hypothetical protein
VRYTLGARYKLGAPYTLGARYQSKNTVIKLLWHKDNLRNKFV